MTARPQFVAILVWLQVVGRQRVRVLGTHNMLVVYETRENYPWTLPPSKRRVVPEVVDPLTEEFSVVRSNLLWLDKFVLTPSLTNCIIQLAAFQNPCDRSLEIHSVI